MKYIYAALMTIMMLVSVGILTLDMAKTDKNPDEFSVLLVHNPDVNAATNGELEAYSYVMREEGMPFESVSPTSLLTADPAETAKKHPAIIFIDGANKYVPGEVLFWTTRYMEAGGNILIAFDAGVMSLNGAYLERAFFEPIVGVNYIRYCEVGEHAYATAKIKFNDKFEGKLFQFPPGKLSDDFFISGFAYEKLKYPVAAAKISDEKFFGNVLAQALLPDGSVYPAVTYNPYRNGLAMFVNLPLGMLKAKASDDLPLRAVLRAFLISFVKIPRVINADEGKGALSIVWQFEADEKPETAVIMAELKLLRSGFGASSHVAYGPYSRRSEVTVERCAPVKALAESLLRFGPVGMLGAFETTWFDGKGRFVQNGPLAEFYAKAHKNCLEEVDGLKIMEFSAANSFVPQPTAPEILSKLGIAAYVYSGDGGAPPNQAFNDGKVVSTAPQTYSFPRSPFGEYGSFKELSYGGVEPEKAAQWLEELARFCADEKTTRTVSFMAKDLFENPQYIESLVKFFDDMELFKETGKIVIKPIGEIAKFNERFKSLNYKFYLLPTALKIKLQLKDGLKGIAVAIPKSAYEKPADGPYVVEWDDYRYYLRITENPNELEIAFPLR